MMRVHGVVVSAITNDNEATARISKYIENETMDNELIHNNT